MAPTIRASRGCSAPRSRRSRARIFLQERTGDGWRKLTYEQARRTVDALAAALLERGLSAERPVMILSANAIDHALLMLAGYTAGMPVAPISVAYSLQSQDFAKLKHIAELLEPGLIYVADTAPFAKALAAIGGSAENRREPRRREPRRDAVRRSRRVRAVGPAVEQGAREPAPTPSRNSCSPPARPACPRASSTPTAC